MLGGAFFFLLMTEGWLQFEFLESPPPPPTFPLSYMTDFMHVDNFRDSIEKITERREIISPQFCDVEDRLLNNEIRINDMTYDYYISAKLQNMINEIISSEIHQKSFALCKSPSITEQFH